MNFEILCIDFCYNYFLIWLTNHIFNHMLDHDYETSSDHTNLKFQNSCLADFFIIIFFILIKFNMSIIFSLKSFLAAIIFSLLLSLIFVFTVFIIFVNLISSLSKNKHLCYKIIISCSIYLNIVLTIEFNLIFNILV